MRIRGRFIMALGALVLWTFVAAGNARAQAAAPAGAKPAASAPQSIKQRISDVEIQVGSIKQQLEELSGEAGMTGMRQKLQDLEKSLDKLKEIEEAGVATKSDLDESKKKIEDLEAQLKTLSEQTAALTRELDEMKQHPLAGYDGHFYIQSADKQHRLDLLGVVRVTYRARFANDNRKSNFKGQEFDLVNVRLGATAKLWEVLHLALSVDIGRPWGEVFFPFVSSENPDQAEMVDNRVYLDYDVIQLADGYGEYAPFEFLVIRAGQFKVPFDRETLTDETNLTFTTRSIMTQRFSRDKVSRNAANYAYMYERGSSFGRDVGAELTGTAWKQQVGWAAGIFNGAGSNTSMSSKIEWGDHYGTDAVNYSGNTMANDNRDILVALRAWVDPLGPVSPGYTDFDSTETPKLSVGLGFAYDRPEHRDIYDPAKTYDSSDIAATLDGVFKYYGAHLGLGGFYGLRDYGDVFNRPKVDLGGLMVEAGYYIKWIRSEVAFRYSMFDPDFQLKLDHMHEITAAFAHYIFGPNLKFQLEYGILLPSSETRAYLGPSGQVPLSSENTGRYYTTHEIRVAAQYAF